MNNTYESVLSAISLITDNICNYIKKGEYLCQH